MGPVVPTDAGDEQGGRNGVLLVLTAAAFWVFLQAFMVAPILPRLAAEFSTSVNTVGLAIPAYLIPYGLMSLIWGPITDRVGRRGVITACLAALALVTGATATAQDVGWFIFWRAAAGIVASGVIPVSVALLADLVPYRSRGHALGWLFGGMAGGMAVGSTAGALAEPALGWQGLFVAVALGTVLVFGAALITLPRLQRPASALGVVEVLVGYGKLLRGTRARRAYSYVAINAVIQSGIYAWLGVYLHERFGLGPTGIGLALLGYGIPGFVFGPAIGRAADRDGRARLIPAGVALGGVAALILAVPVPLVVAAVGIAALSLGYDLTQPLLAGIVTDLEGPAGQAVALMAVILFTGFGVGSLVFQAALTAGFTAALGAFGVVALIAAAIAVRVFAEERPAGFTGDRPAAGGPKIPPAVRR